MRHLANNVWKWIAIAAVITAFVIVTPPQPTAEAGIIPEAFKPWSTKGTVSSYHIRGRLFGDKELLGSYPPKSALSHLHRFTCSSLMAGAIWFGGFYVVTGEGFFSPGAGADHIIHSVPEQFGAVNDGTIGVVDARCIDDGPCNFKAGYDDYEYLAILMRDAMENNELGISQPFQIMPLIRAYGLAHEAPERTRIEEFLRGIDFQGLQARLPEDGYIGIPRSKEEVGRIIDAAIQEVEFQNMLMHTLIADLTSAYHPAREEYFQKSNELETARAALESMRRDSETSAGEIRSQERTIETLEGQIATLANQLNAAEETIRQEISDKLGVEVDTAAVRSMLTSPVGNSLLRHLVAVSSFKNYVEALRTRMAETVAEPTDDPLEMDRRMQQLRSYTGTYALTTRIMAVAIQDYITVNEGIHDYFDGIIADAESLIGQMERQNDGFNQPLSGDSQIQYDKNLSDIATQREVIRIARDYQELLTQRNANLEIRYNEMINLFGTLARDVALATTVAELTATIDAMETTAEAMQNVLSDNPQNFFSLTHYTEGIQANYSAEALELFERRIRTDVLFR